MTPYFEPLHVPKPSRSRLERFFDFINFDPTEGGRRHIEKQLARRGAVPSSVWGSDPERLRLAQQVSDCLREELWNKKCHFIPEDPYELIASSSRLGDEPEYCCVQIERMIGRKISEDQWSRLFTLRFGEVVDDLLQYAKGGELAVLSVAETRPCPFLAVFLELRECLRQRNPADEYVRIHPDTPLKGMMGLCHLDRFVKSRFGVSPNIVGLRSVFFFWTVTLSLTTFLPAAMLLLPLESEDYTEERLYIVSLCLFLFGGISTLPFCPAVLARLWRRLRRTRMRVYTLGDLTRWILLERARRKLCPE